MEIIRLTLCGLIFLHPTLEKGQSTGFTQDSTNLGIWAPGRLRRESPFAWDTTPEVTTKDVMQEATTQEPPTTERRMHVGVTPESPTTEGGVHVEATQESSSQEDILREKPDNSSETSSFPDVTLTPYRWLCAGEGKYSIKVHCYCDPVCVLYGDCCYGVTENTTVCAASVRLRGTHAATQSATVLGTNVTETQSDCTMSTESTNKTSSIRGIKLADPVSMSLVHKSSCRRSPTLHRTKPQTRLPYVDNFGLSFWMVDRCPSSWQEKDSRIKCTDISNTSLTEDALLYQPVTDPDTMITFKNKYCAACNGIKNGVEPWGLVIYSTKALLADIANCSSSICVLRKMKDRRSNGVFVPKPEWNLRTCFREDEGDSFGPCKFSFVNGSVLRLSRPLPLHSALRDACMAYNNPVVVSSFDDSYKNFHCMVCYLGDFLPCEDQNSTPPPVRFFGLSLRALLYLGDQGKEQSDDVMTRPVDQQLVCPPGFVPDAQDCRALFYNLTVVRSIVSLHFEPCCWVPTPRDGCRGIRTDHHLVTVLIAAQALFYTCSQKYGADNTSIIFVVKAIVTLQVRLADYEEGRDLFLQVQAKMENSLRYVQLEISGRPVGIRSGSFSACMKNPTIQSSVTPFDGASTLSTPRQSQANSHVGNVGILVFIVMVAAEWDFYM